MKIYIDFDETLFNNNKHYHKLINIFKKYNINKEYIDTLTNNKQYKNLDTLAKEIITKNNLDKSIIKEINTIYSNNLIYKDTIPFLEKHKEDYELILLTLGNKKYQLKKINSTNISKYFKEIIITNKDKSKLNIDYQNSIFIDNNPHELKKFYKSKSKYLIRIKRNNDKYSKINLDLKNIPEFIDFNELLESNYIEKLGETNYE